MASYRLAARGQALVVSIASIKAALGSRWEARRAQVHEVVERHFRKVLSDEDICLPVGETLFMVATPNKTDMVAQAVCYRALKEVLTHFLGSAQPSHLEISQITKLTPDSIDLRTCSVAELVRADMQTRATPKSAPAPSHLSSLSSWPLTTADGQNLRVSFGLDPMMELKGLGMAGHRIESRIVNQATGHELTGLQRRGLLPRDFEKIDLAALDRGLSRLAAYAVPDKPNLILQLSFASLSNGRARAALLDRARDLQTVLQHAVICELVDMAAGIPVGRLVEVVSLVRGFFRSIWVQVEADRTAINTAVGAKVSGIAVRAADLGETPQAMAAAMRGFAQMARANHPKMPLAISSLPNADLMVDAMSAGFNFASLHAPR